MKTFTVAGPKHSEIKRVFRNKTSRLPGFTRGLLFALLLAFPGSLLALKIATPSLEKRVDSSEKVFVGKLVDRVQADGWVKADLLVEEPLMNVRKGELVPVTWRLFYGAGPFVTRSVEGDNGVKKVERAERKPVFDRAAGARGIAILDHKHNGRYWLRADKYEDINKLAKVRELVGRKTEEAPQPAGKSLADDPGTKADDPGTKPEKIEIRHSMLGYRRDTLVFYTFKEQRAIMVLQISNKDETFPVIGKVYLFDKATTEEGLKKWINNQHSDGIYVDPPKPIFTTTLPAEFCKVTSGKQTGTSEDPGISEKMFKDFELALSIKAQDVDGRFELPAFTDTVRVHVKCK